MKKSGFYKRLATEDTEITEEKRVNRAPSVFSVPSVAKIFLVGQIK